MRYAIIENGAVVNVIEAQADAKFPDGWSTIASETANIGDLFNELSGDFVPPDPLPPEPPTVAEYQAAIEAYVDATAVARQYRDAISLASYANSTVPGWATEAGIFVAWRDAVWQYAYGQLELVQAGSRDVPTVAEFIAELPAIEW